MNRWSTSYQRVIGQFQWLINHQSCHEPLLNSHEPLIHFSTGTFSSQGRSRASWITRGCGALRVQVRMVNGGRDPPKIGSCDFGVITFYIKLYIYTYNIYIHIYIYMLANWGFIMENMDISKARWVDKPTCKRAPNSHRRECVFTK